MTEPALIASCWTSAGDTAPLRASELSPYDAQTRVREVSASGWEGLGFVLDDLRRVRASIGYDRLADDIRSSELTHVEVELCSGWWTDDGAWRRDWDDLLDAAQSLGASFIKIATAMAPQVDDLEPFVKPLRRLAIEAEAHGTRVALEPFPFGMIATVPQGAQLIDQVAHPAAGLIIDFWHVFRAGTSFAELSESVNADVVFGVELCDADAEVVGTLFEDTRDNRRLIGEGVQDVAGFVETMRAIGFAGPWGVEILSAEHRQRPLREGLELARTTTLSAFR
ncbi:MULTISPECIES: sugar phosphate isomerase/epimerase family protein [Brevibacterium]|uniref:Sugar phosphate isomerase/epimerase n=1 Tax=Brevibacterium casei TaxID=33889 RepID=A0A7T4DJR7_9MICO|nr:MULTISPECIES: sugar phosphate isomerase/epimerase family protein [Brevibacterium]MCM1013465.1 sugar phosphate isomerase/epimerase [Brevibacterium sp. XM4083]MCT1764975.1 sugar phosphate isomerase/epimerase [Brevibacterium casei]QQB15892.1 sugar phosphate isomerase/epimerase [Brevibacterium casei]